MKCFCIIVMLFILSIRADYDLELFQEIKSVSETILEKCPAGECLVLAVGRSPTPIVEYMKLVGRDDVVQVPLSSFKYLDKEFSFYYENGVEIAAPEGEKALTEHLNKYIPERLPKNIVVIDITYSGSSLFTFEQKLIQFLKAKYANKVDLIPVTKSIPIVQSDYIETLMKRWRKARLITPGDVIEIKKNGPLHLLMSGHNSDDLAPFGHYPPQKILSREKVVTNNAEARVVFLDWIKKEFEKDSLSSCSMQLGRLLN